MDPDELRPEIRFRRGATPEETRQIIIRDARISYERRGLAPGFIEHNIQRLLTEDLEALEHGAMSRTHKRLEDYWILSLSSSRTEPRMWAEFAGDARGVCIHFRVRHPTADPDAYLFGLSQEVDYVDPRPPLAGPCLDMDEQEIGRRSLLVKSPKFRHEQEFRFVRYPRTSFAEVGLHFVGQHGHFNDQEVISVSVHPAIPSSYLKALKALLRQRERKIPLYFAPL
jgi:hypothetical protein